MKRVSFVLFLLLCVCFAHAEQMQFVTTLSSPMGTFAQVETADPASVTVAPLVNFCNSRASVGAVALKGADAYLETLSLKNATVLGGDTPEFRISGALNVTDGAEVTGGRLMADKLSVQDAPEAKSKVDDTLHMTSLQVKGAKTESLTIPGQVQTAQGETAGSVQWTNENACDYETVASTPDYEEMYTVAYNPDTQRFKSCRGEIDSRDTCDGDFIKEYTGTVTRDCIDVYMMSSPVVAPSRPGGIDTSDLYPYSNPVYFYQTQSDCPDWSTCALGDKLLNGCEYGNGYSSKDLSYALSSSNYKLTEAERLTKYAITPAQAKKFWGGLKKAYNYWNGEYNCTLDHASTFYACLMHVSAEVNYGLYYRVSVGRALFNARKRKVKSDTGGDAQCVANGKTYDSFLLRGR